MSNDLLATLKATADADAAAVWAPIQKQMAEENEDKPRYWKPAHGAVEGTVERVYLKDNYDKTAKEPAVDLRNATGVVVVTAGNVVLRNRLAELAPGKGDYLRIVPGPIAPGKKYRTYEVSLDRPAAADGAAPF